MPIVAVLFSWGMALIVGCSKETPAPSTAATAPKPKLASSALPKFVDATAAVGIHFAHVNGGSGRSYYVETYGSGAAFVDYDSDGDEDLYLVNGAVLPGFLERCVPQNALYRNRGNGKFEEITAQAGVGDADLFVANDKTPNFLFRNEGGTRFSNIGLTSGVAFSPDGKPEAGMGTDFGDYDNDGLLDIVVCNFQWEHCRLLKNERGDVFKDRIHESKLDEPTFSTLTFGTDFLDYDNDGDLDLFLANGHIEPNIEIIDRAGPSYAQRDQLFHNNGDGTFSDVSSDSPGLANAWVGRGSATADYDNDGDLDLFVANNNQRGLLLRNDGGNRQHWLSVRTVGTHSNRNGIGARIRVVAGQLQQVEEVRSGSSYLSQNALRVHFGLGAHTRVDRVEIRWPSGVEQVLEDVAVDQFLTIQEPEKL